MGTLPGSLGPPDFVQLNIPHSLVAQITCLEVYRRSKLGSGGQTLQVRAEQSGRLPGPPVKQTPPSGPHEEVLVCALLLKARRQPSTPSFPEAFWMECQTCYLVTSLRMLPAQLRLLNYPTLIPPSPGNPSSLPLCVGHSLCGIYYACSCPV